MLENGEELRGSEDQRVGGMRSGAVLENGEELRGSEGWGMRIGEAFENGEELRGSESWRSKRDGEKRWGIIWRFGETGVEPSLIL